MTTTRRRLLSAADGAWWRMEHPTNPMTITIVLTFAERLSYDALAALVRRDLLRRDRFHARVVDPGLGWPYWERVPRVHVADQVVTERLPARAGRRELEALVGRLMSQPLPDDRPLWRLHLVEDYRGGSALVARVHHCMADGIALVRLLLSLAEPADAGPPAAVPGTTARRPDGAGPLGAVAGALRVGGGVAATFGRLLDLRADGSALLRRPLGRVKRVAWSEPVPLARVRALARDTGGTINDVLVAAVAASLRRYLGRRGERVPRLRAIVPVNLRPADDGDALGNRFGLVFLTLAVGERDPLQRVTATKRAMDALKRSPEAVVLYDLLRGFALATGATLRAAVRLLSRRASAVLTNVPGPRAPLRFAGALVDGVMFWVPCSGSIGLGVSVLSYAGTVRVGVAADAHVVAHPEALVSGFHDALAELRRTTHPRRPRRGPRRFNARRRRASEG